MFPFENVWKQVLRWSGGDGRQGQKARNKFPIVFLTASFDDELQNESDESALAH